MASNPIQRRARQSFLVGFLIAIIIGAVIAVLLFMRMSSLQTQLETAQAAAATKIIYVASQDIKSGEVITSDMLTTTTVLTSFNTSAYIDMAYLNETDEEGNEIEYVAKVDIQTGSLITGEMVTDSENQLDDSDRIIEYNMISLPSQLQNHDYVDIRISMPDGTDYIVLSKKYVEQTTATGIWMTMSEIDILTLNSAIVESYMIEGSRLYAVVYAEAGLQEAATATYAASDAVLNAITADVNIVDEAKTALAERLQSYTLGADNGQTSDWDYERSVIESYLNTLDSDDKTSAVESGNATEDATIAEDREEYVENLDGTGLVGTTY